MAQARHKEAESAFRQALERQDVAIAKGPDYVEFRQRRSSHFAGLALTLRAQGRADEAVAVARQNRAFCKNDPIELYNAARALAVCRPIVRDDAGAGPLPPRRLKRCTPR